jgi:hypothetical protein
MRKILLLIAFLVRILVTSDTVYGQDNNWLMHGNVKWSTGTAAVSVKLRLLQNNKEKAVTYTNQNGDYGFYGVKGQPGDYTLEASFNNRVFKTFNPDDLRQKVPQGGRLDFSVSR